MKNLLFLASIACFLIIVLFLIYNVPAFSQTIFGFLRPEKTANPAAQFCLSEGGNRVSKTTSEGNAYGFCEFPDGSVCEEWAFYRGTCHSPQVQE